MNPRGDGDFIREGRASGCHLALSYLNDTILSRDGDTAVIDLARYRNTVTAAARRLDQMPNMGGPLGYHDKLHPEREHVLAVRMLVPVNIDQRRLVEWALHVAACDGDGDHDCNVTLSTYLSRDMGAITRWIG
jgi:hypothetical protein